MKRTKMESEVMADVLCWDAKVCDTFFCLLIFMNLWCLTEMSLLVYIEGVNLNLRLYNLILYSCAREGDELEL